MRLHLLFAAAAVASLGGCIHPVDTANAPSFGRANAAMLEAQTIPAPVSEEPPEGSGAVGALGVDRYKTGQTVLTHSSTSDMNSSD